MHVCCTKAPRHKESALAKYPWAPEVDKFTIPALDALKRARAVLGAAHPAAQHPLLLCRYVDLLHSSLRVADLLRQDASREAPAEPSSGHNPRVAVMADPGAGYVASTFGTWLDRGIAVPLCLSHPDRWAVAGGGRGLACRAAGAPSPLQLRSQASYHWHPATHCLTAHHFPRPSQVAAVRAGGRGRVIGAGHREAR